MSLVLTCIATLVCLTACALGFLSELTLFPKTERQRRIQDQVPQAFALLTILTFAIATLCGMELAAHHANILAIWGLPALDIAAMFLLLWLGQQACSLREHHWRLC